MPEPTHTEKGQRIVPLDEKLENLRYCMQGGHYEDAAGHLCDLLEECRTRCVSHDGRIFVGLAEMARHYGKNLVPVPGCPKAAT